MPASHQDVILDTPKSGRHASLRGHPEETCVDFGNEKSNSFLVPTVGFQTPHSGEHHEYSCGQCPLSIASSTFNNLFFGQIAIGNNVLSQQINTGGGYYWFVVINRSTLKVEYNQVQTANNVAPNIGALNTNDHILVVATLGVGLNVPPQGALFDFLDQNGGGYHLRRVDQFGQQFNCGSWGTFGYALCSVLGNQNLPGFEDSSLGNGTPGPFLTIQLMPKHVQRPDGLHSDSAQQQLEHSALPCAGGWRQNFGKVLAAARENPHTHSEVVLVAKNPRSPSAAVCGRGPQWISAFINPTAARTFHFGIATSLAAGRLV